MITEQVWIIDDDSSIRWVLEKALSSVNISSASFDNAENMLIALEQGQPELQFIADLVNKKVLPAVTVKQATL